MRSCVSPVDLPTIANSVEGWMNAFDLVITFFYLGIEFIGCKCLLWFWMVMILLVCSFFSLTCCIEYHVWVWGTRAHCKDLCLFLLQGFGLWNLCSLQGSLFVSAARIWFVELVLTARSVWGAHRVSFWVR